MMKKPKHEYTPNISKIPKQNGAPGEFKEMNPSWQTCLLDFEGNWGLNSISDKVRFRFDEELYKILEEDISDELFETLFKLNNNEFTNFNDFIQTLCNKLKIEIKPKHLREIIKYAEKYFFENKIYPKLKEFEEKTWYEIEQETYGNNKRKTKHHTVPISKLCKKAQQRLKELRMDDIDELFSLRLEGKIRIFGIRKFNYLQIIWIDPNHTVYPVSKG